MSKTSPDLKSLEEVRRAAEIEALRLGKDIKDTAYWPVLEGLEERVAKEEHRKKTKEKLDELQRPTVEMNSFNATTGGEYKAGDEVVLVGEGEEAGGSSGCCCACM